jgi:hypothetical protein
MRLTDYEAGRVRRGFVTLAELHTTMCDGDVIRLVEKVGPDRVLHAIDMMTAPTLVAAE